MYVYEKYWNRTCMCWKRQTKSERNHPVEIFIQQFYGMFFVYLWIFLMILIFFLNGTAPMFPSMFSNKPINQTKSHDKVQINFSDSQEIVEFPIYICHIKTPSIICQKSELYFVLEELCKHVITQERKKVTGDPVTERADSHEECKWQQKG